MCFLPAAQRLGHRLGLVGLVVLGKTIVLKIECFISKSYKKIVGLVVLGKTIVKNRAIVDLKLHI